MAILPLPSLSLSLALPVLLVALIHSFKMHQEQGVIQTSGTPPQNCSYKWNRIAVGIKQDHFYQPLGYYYDNRWFNYERVCCADTCGNYCGSGTCGDAGADDCCLKTIVRSGRRCTATMTEGCYLDCPMGMVEDPTEKDECTQPFSVSTEIPYANIAPNTPSGTTFTCADAYTAGWLNCPTATTTSCSCSNQTQSVSCSSKSECFHACCQWGCTAGKVPDASVQDKCVDTNCKIAHRAGLAQCLDLTGGDAACVQTTSTRKGQSCQNQTACSQQCFGANAMR
eukprot:TRINITY_DN10499_c0_g1_i1.p1 TRINITY_DN10499_c0_g1~~TRINITY_DN10499_c0_g1_i1.p1  ORF type:complete len:282 (+),score=21.91 TRINITY_DN10499_c0_g1_i1:76-921(+)